MSKLRFNTLLAEAGLDLEKVRLVRQAGVRGGRGGAVAIIQRFGAA